MTRLCTWLLVAILESATAVAGMPEPGDLSAQPAFHRLSDAGGPMAVTGLARVGNSVAVSGWYLVGQRSRLDMFGSEGQQTATFVLPAVTEPRLVSNSVGQAFLYGSVASLRPLISSFVASLDSQGRLAWCWKTGEGFRVLGLAPLPDGSAIGVGARFRERPGAILEQIDLGFITEPFAFKVGAEGRVVWAERLRLSADDDLPRKVVADSKGDVYVLGQNWVMALTDGGTVRWARRLLVNGALSANFVAIAATRDSVEAAGRIVQSGTRVLAAVVALGANGKMRWASAVNVGLLGAVAGMAPLDDGGVVLVGETQRMGPSLEDRVGLNKASLFQFDAMGRLSSGLTVGDGSNVDLFEHALQIGGSLFLAGKVTREGTGTENELNRVALPIGRKSKDGDCPNPSADKEHPSVDLEQFDIPTERYEVPVQEYRPDVQQIPGG